MRTRSIVIAVSVILAMVLFFSGLMVLVRVAAETSAEAKRQERMKVDLPESGIILRYSEGLYTYGYDMVSGSDFNPCSENNIQISVYADGRVVAEYFPYDNYYYYGGDAPREEMTLTSAELDKLKDMIQNSGIRNVETITYNTQLEEGDSAVTVIHDRSGVTARSMVCRDEELPYEEDRENTLKLINYAADIMGEEKTKAFREEIKEWKQTYSVPDMPEE